MRYRVVAELCGPNARPVFHPVCILGCGWLVGGGGGIGVLGRLCVPWKDIAHTLKRMHIMQRQFDERCVSVYAQLHDTECK